MLKIYGASDDLIEIEGQTNNEISAYDVNIKFEFIDGTIAIFSYGKGESAIWKCDLISIGDKFDKLEECFDEEAEIYSDILYLKDSQECLIKRITEL
jgi:hypothetical protein